jgi:cobalamin biosynthesis protein CbiG
MIEMKGISKVFWIGIGCQKGVSQYLIGSAILQVFESHDLDVEAIAGIATIDLKANEPGLVEFCRDRNLPLVTFPSQVLKTIHVVNYSAVVAAKIGTFSVAEAAAICVTNSEPIVPKQIFRLPGETGAVTLAIAQTQNEWRSLF